MTPFPRVLFVAAETYSQVGGLQQFNRRVFSNLIALAADAAVTPPQLFVLRDPPGSIPDMGNAKITTFASRPALIRSLVRAARDFDILLIGHVNLLPVSVLAKLFHRSMKTILFVHGDEVWGDPVYRATRRYEPLLARSLDRVASVSAFTAGRMAKAFRIPSDTFRILPNAVDAVTQPLPIDIVMAREPLILTVSRLAPHDRGKNIDAVIRAFAELAPRVPAARLEIVGDGAIRPELEALSRSLKLERRVVFRGRISDDALQQAYQRATVFAMPSAKEGFGIVFLEAWLRGLPVICGTEDAAHEIVSDGQDGFAIAPSDVTGLAAAMEQLLTNMPLAQQMGQAGRQKVMQNYLNEHFRRNLRQIITDVRHADAAR